MDRRGFVGHVLAIIAGWFGISTAKASTMVKPLRLDVTVAECPVIGGHHYQVFLSCPRCRHRLAVHVRTSNLELLRFRSGEALMKHDIGTLAVRAVKADIDGEWHCAFCRAEYARLEAALSDKGDDLSLLNIDFGAWRSALPVEPPTPVKSYGVFWVGE